MDTLYDHHNFKNDDMILGADNGKFRMTQLGGDSASMTGADSSG